MSDKTSRDLLESLFIEVFQAEESARVHPKREAKRLGLCPPAAAMLRISEHGSESLRRLKELAQARGLQRQTMGTVIGHLLSDVRTFGTDLFLTPDKTYRGTLMGIHHGIGAMLLLEDVAIERGDQELADFCSSWVVTRRELTDIAEDALAWFAQNSDAALGVRRRAAASA